MTLGRAQTIHLEVFPSALIPAALVLLITITRFGVRQGFAASALLLLSLLAHEAAHIVAAQMSGKRVAAVGFCWKGAYNRRERAEGAAEFMISAAGPAMNLALAVVLMRQTGLAGWFAQVNLVLGVFNLLPIRGSDGQRMLVTLRERVSRQRSASAVEPSLGPPRS